jgi:hypothetical protein
VEIGRGVGPNKKHAKIISA